VDTAIFFARPADDQPIAFHARQGIGKGRLFDIQQFDQVLLGLAFLCPKRDQRRKHAG